MYPYHNKIKQRINNGELVSYEFVEEYNKISPCLLLHFSTEPKIRPIRIHRFDEYRLILDSDLEKKINVCISKRLFLFMHSFVISSSA